MTYFHVHAIHDTQGRLSMLATYTQRDGVITPSAAAERYVMMALPGCKIDRIGGARTGNFDCFSATNPSYPDQPHLVIVTTTES